MFPVGVQGDVAALVADEIFIVSGEEVDASAAESSGAGVLVEEEVQPLPMLLYEPVSDGFDSHFAFTRIQAAPPDEVFESGRGVAPEIAVGKLR